MMYGMWLYTFPVGYNTNHVEHTNNKSKHKIVLYRIVVHVFAGSNICMVCDSGRMSCPLTYMTCSTTYKERRIFLVNTVA